MADCSFSENLRHIAKAVKPIYMKKFHLVNDDNFYSDLTTSSEAEDADGGTEAVALGERSGGDGAAEEEEFIPQFPNPAESDSGSAGEAAEEEEEGEEAEEEEEEEEEAEEEAETEEEEAPMRKQSRAAPDSYAQAVEKIYQFFNRKYSHELILKAIHANAGSLQNAIYDLAKTPSAFVDVSLFEPPNKAKLPLRVKLQYTNR